LAFKIVESFYLFLTDPIGAESERENQIKLQMSLWSHAGWLDVQKYVASLIAH